MPPMEVCNLWQSSRLSVHYHWLQLSVSWLVVGCFNWIVWYLQTRECFLKILMLLRLQLTACAVCLHTVWWCECV